MLARYVIVRKLPWMAIPPPMAGVIIYQRTILIYIVYTILVTGAWLSARCLSIGKLEGGSIPEI